MWFTSTRLTDMDSVRVSSTTRALIIVTLSCLVKFSLTFNVDTKFPIIYEAKSLRNGTLFGYATALHKNKDGFYALVTAPKANSTVLRQIVEPGVLYKCLITVTANVTKPCKEVVVDRYGNHKATGLTEEFDHKDKKDGMWLGVSLDTQPIEPYHVVVCGHLWKNSLYIGQYLANGVCYLLNKNLEMASSKKLLPLVRKSMQSIYPPGIYKHAMGQAGTSAAFSENGNDLLLGAPGFYDWLGTVVEYKVPYYTSQDTKAKVPDNPPWSESPSHEAYIGYSVTSGHFFQLGGMSYVAGAPRDSACKGRVYIVDKLGYSRPEFAVQQKINGEQLGEYFGATVLGVNFDMDEYTDLIVGAPFHSFKNGGDEGRVYVYYSDGVGLQPQKDVIAGSKIPGSRFGSSIAKINDINQDGFTDVAIGAPYEDKNGAVYIYHGTKTGLKPQFSQRITATEVNTGLSGFGTSLARAMDIDDNSYPDLLIGASNSDKAVLLRSRPVIQVSSRIEFNVSQIDINRTHCEYKGRKVACFSVATCLKYSGKHVSEVIDFLVRLDLDVAQEEKQRPKRGYFLHEDRVSTTLLEGVSLQLGKHQCFERLVHVHEDIQDFISPMVFQMNYTLLRDSQPIDSFCGSCPLLDTSSQTSVTNEIFFRTSCGDDNTCTSDLKTKASVVNLEEDEPIILGANDSIVVDVRVENRGEPAYASSLFIKLPTEILIINQAHCHIVDTVDNTKQDDSADDNGVTGITKNGGSSLECKLGNPLPAGVTNAFQIKLDISKVESTEHPLIIELEATTASDEKNPRDNRYYLRVPFKSLADITIRGHAEREQIVYESKADLVPIIHKYVVLKYLPSPIKSVGIAIYLPQTDKITGTEFAIIDAVEVGDGKSTVPGSCNVTLAESIEGNFKFDTDRDVLINVEDTSGKDAPNTINLLNKRAKRNLDAVNDGKEVPAEKKNSREKRDDKWYETGNKNQILNCSTTICKVLVCSAGPFIDTNKVATITVRTLANLTALRMIYGDTGNATYITEGKVWIRDLNYDPQPEGHRPDYDYAVTSLISPLQPSKTIDNWIIAISVGVGFLLLALILLALIRLGFFRRQKRDDMQKMMQEGALISGKSMENDDESNADKDEFDYINYANSNT